MLQMLLKTNNFYIRINAYNPLKAINNSRKQLFLFVFLFKLKQIDKNPTSFMFHMSMFI